MDFGLLDGSLGAFHAKFVAGQLGAHLEPKACGSLESIRKDTPIVSSCIWVYSGVLHHVLRLVKVTQEGEVRTHLDTFAGMISYVFF